MNLKPIVHPRSFRKDPGKQLTLFPEFLSGREIEIKSSTQAAPYIGDWAEEYVATVTGGERLALHANRVCPDIQIGPNWFMEVKAISLRNCFVLYRKRFQKYRKMHEEGSKIHFALVHHELEASKPRNLTELRSGMAAQVQKITIVPWVTIYKEVRRILKQKGWSRSEKRTENYREYIRFGSKWLNSFHQAKPHRPQRAFRTVVYGQEVGYVPVRAYKTKMPPGAHIGLHPPEVREAAVDMLWELHTNRHEVVLAPLSDGRKIRVVQEHNPDWYTKLRREYYIGKRAESLVQRRNIIHALEAMIEDRKVAPAVEERLLPYIDAWIEDNRVPF